MNIVVTVREWWDDRTKTRALTEQRECVARVGGGLHEAVSQRRHCRLRRFEACTNSSAYRIIKNNLLYYSIK